MEHARSVVDAGRGAFGGFLARMGPVRAGLFSAPARPSYGPRCRALVHRHRGECHNFRCEFQSSQIVVGCRAPTCPNLPLFCIARVDAPQILIVESESLVNALDSDIEPSVLRNSTKCRASLGMYTASPGPSDTPCSRGVQLTSRKVSNHYSNILLVTFFATIMRNYSSTK